MFIVQFWKSFKTCIFWNFLAGGGGQKSKTSPRAPTEPGYAYFRPLPIITPLIEIAIWLPNPNPPPT